MLMSAGITGVSRDLYDFGSSLGKVKRCQTSSLCDM